MTNRIEPDAETLVAIYRRMALIKANDERSRKVIMTGRLVMPYYSPRGQEVIPSAVSANLNETIISAPSIAAFTTCSPRVCR